MKFSSVFSAISVFLHDILFYTIGYFCKDMLLQIFLFPPDFFVLIISA